MTLSKDKVNSRLWSVYIYLFSICYISVYIDYQLSPIFVWPILLISYYLMIFKGRVEPVLFLILGSKFITGFAVPTNTSAFIVMNICVNYLPVFILLLVHGSFVLKKQYIYHYKFSICYFLLALVYSLPYPELSSQLIIKEYFPFLLFILTAGIFRKNLDYSLIMRFLRPLFISSILIYLIPWRIEANTILNTLPLLGRVLTQISIDFLTLDVFRNGGFLWDTRIMGSISYVFIYIALVKEKSNLNVGIGLIILFSTLSRGSIAVGIMLLLVYLFLQIIKGKFIKPTLVTCTLLSVLILAVKFDVVKIQDGYLDSFSIFSEKNAFSQREGFRKYSLDSFYDNPLGSGVGSLKGVGPSREIPVEGGTFNTVTDAFLFSKLGEMGILGFILFILAIGEIIICRSVYSLALFLGLLIQLIGTDLPDFKQFYFVFLVLISSRNLFDNKKYIGSLSFEKN